jgi:hypothetical protein
MFRALLSHPHEALNKRRWAYCVRVMSAAPGFDYNPGVAPPEDKQVMLERCRGS